jgi:hypothetical protein
LFEFIKSLFLSIYLLIYKLKLFFSKIALTLEK